MWCIQLMDTLFNINNKKMGRDMAHAEQLHLLPEEQSGSRHHRSAPSGLWTKVLLYNLSRIQQQNMAIPCLDAGQCYNCMAHNMLSLSLQRLRVPLRPIQSLLDVLQEAHHRPLTAYDPSYGGPNWSQQQGLDPLMGPGQGNRMAPMGYVFLSEAIVTMLKQENLQSSFTSAISNCSLEDLVSVMFVDDANLFVTPTPASSNMGFLGRIQLSSVDHWSGGLHATGGAICQEKSHWFHLKHDISKWNNPSYFSMDKAPGHLYLPDKDGSLLPILHKEPTSSSAVRTLLGMAWSPSMSMKGQIDHFKTKISQFTHSLSCCSFCYRNDVWLAFKAGILKTLEYPLLACSLTKKQWDLLLLLLPQLQRVLPPQASPGVFPICWLIWGSHDYCAFNLVHHPWYTQELRRLGEIIHCVNTQSINGTYLCALWENIKLAWWCSSQPLTAIPPTLDILIMDCSLKTTYQTLPGWNMTLSDSLPNLLLFRKHDQLLGGVLSPHNHLH